MCAGSILVTTHPIYSRRDFEYRMVAVDKHIDSDPMAPEVYSNTNLYFYVKVVCGVLRLCLSPSVAQSMWCCCCDCCCVCCCRRRHCCHPCCCDCDQPGDLPPCDVLVQGDPTTARAVEVLTALQRRIATRKTQFNALHRLGGAH